MKYKGTCQKCTVERVVTDEKDQKTVLEGSGKLDFGEYELELWDQRYNSLVKRVRGGGGSGGWCGRVRGWVRPSCVPLTIMLALSLLILIMALPHTTTKPSDCQCRFQLVESIPENLTYSPGSVSFPSIYEAWAELLDQAQHSVDIAAFYWTLLAEDVTSHPCPSAWLGEDILQRLNHTGLKENIRMRIAQNSASRVSPQHDSKLLAASGAAEVRSLNFSRLMGGGVLHTKLWVVDGRHFYVGSANMDWRSLTQVKEVGVVVHNCSCLAADVAKIFEVYWMLGAPGAVIPAAWPSFLQTVYNMAHQMTVPLSDGAAVNTYLSSSPPPFCPRGRSNDIDAIVDVISKARKFVYIAVMDYFPRMLYTKEKRWWPVIDESLRRVALEGGVQVRVLASHWNHTRPDMKYFLRSLQDLSSPATRMHIEARLFVVPAASEEQRQIPFARVNHNKYMVTDNTAYIGTSNWSADYFINTGGVGLVVNETEATTTGAANSSLRHQLQQLFIRDWTSQHARPLSEFFPSSDQT